MSNKNSSEELQSHRRFFKQAVRAGCIGSRTNVCHIILAVVSFVCMLPMYAMAQTSGEPQPSVIIERLTGQDITMALAKVGKLTFTNDSVYLVAHEGTILGREAKSQTRRIVFGNTSTPSATPQVSDNNILVFPNPAADHIIVNGVETGTTVRIYANDGKPLEATTANGNTATLQVSHLAQGTYLLQVNTQIVKFIKQ